MGRLISGNPFLTDHRTFSKAAKADPGDVNVIYMVAHEPSLYYENVMASTGPGGITRQMAITGYQA